MKRIGLGVLVIALSLVFGAWIGNLSWRKDLIDRYWGWVWMAFCFDVFWGGISGVANVWYISLIFSILECLWLSWVLPGLRKSCFTAFLMLALFFILNVGGFEIAFVIQGVNNVVFTLSILYLVIFALGLLGIIYQLTCKKKWTLMTKHEKW